MLMSRSILIRVPKGVGVFQRSLCSPSTGVHLSAISLRSVLTKNRRWAGWVTLMKLVNSATFRSSPCSLPDENAESHAVQLAPHAVYQSIVLSPSGLLASYSKPPYQRVASAFPSDIGKLTQSRRRKSIPRQKVLSPSSRHWYICGESAHVHSSNPSPRGSGHPPY